MRKKQHMQIGAIAGGITYAGYYACQRNRDENYEFNPLTLGMFILAGVAGGCLPDLIEPASDPNHRKFWHSVTCAGVLNVGHCFLPAPLKTATFPLLFGYNSHLLADNTTSLLPTI